MRFANQATRLLLFTSILIFTYALLIPCGEANTPWGLVAGRIIGRVKQLSQKPKEDQPGFDVATVILSADPPKYTRRRST
nr:hypothetical protein Hi04_10k_c4997_00018 [uncultured bacterium]